nr:putative reverse transcriptase domain-containing protein [Tanacetum cinerariifolium]
MEILLESTSNSSAVGSVDGVTTSFQQSQNSRPPMLDHQNKYMIKAQVHVSKSSAISNVQPLPRRKHYCQIYQVGRGNQGNQARDRAFMLGAEEACHDLNIVTGTFTLNDHFANTLFDSGADYSFVSTTFIPLLGIEPSDLGFRYETEIPSGQLVEIDKVIKGCKLKIESHVFDIDLIPFGHGSFDVIIDGKVLRVLGEKPDEKIRELKSTKAKDKDKKQREIVVARDFPKKCKTFDWGKEQELAFQTLKDKLCNAPVLALLEGPKDFMAYCDVSGIGLGCVLMQRGKVIAYASRQLKIHEKNYTTHDLEIELFSDYDYEIRYHPGKENVVVDALSRKEIVKPKRVRDMNIILQSSIKNKIIAAQKEAVDEIAGLQKGDDKMYYDLRDRYWWPEMKKDKAENEPEIPVWKWKRIAMNFVTKLPRTSSGHDTIWVIVDRLTKSIYFLPICEDYKMESLAWLYLNEIVARHGVPILIILDRDSRFASRFWQPMQKALGTRLDMSTTYHPQTDGQSKRTIQNLEDMLRAYVLDFRGSWDVHFSLVEFSNNNSYHSSVRYAQFEALYGRKYHSSIMWTGVGEGQLIRLKLVHETTEKISQIKDRLKAARDHQKSYADKRTKPLEFSAGDYVLLKVSP